MSPYNASEWKPITYSHHDGNPLDLSGWICYTAVQKFGICKILMFFFIFIFFY